MRSPGSVSGIVLFLLALTTIIAQHSYARKMKVPYEEKDMGQGDHDGHIEIMHHDKHMEQHQLHDDGYKMITITKNHHEHDLHPSSSSHTNDHHHIDPLLYVFFTLTDLKIGKARPIYFPYTNPSSTPKLLLRNEANSIPFSSSKLETLLKLFSLPKNSAQAKAIEYTLTQCELESIQGEIKFCATSLESMLDFAHKMLGFDTQMKVLTTTRLSNKSSTVAVQNYTILEEPREIFATKIVACHGMPYPYAVFYCHCQESKNRVFEILLGDESGERVKASAICHMDTSQWDKDHASFRVLKTQPGESHVCHFVSTDSFVWVSH